MSGEIVLHGGDWGEGTGRYLLKKLFLPMTLEAKTRLLTPSPAKPEANVTYILKPKPPVVTLKRGETEAVELAELSDVEIASEETIESVSASFGWAAVGGLALGPVGLLAGLLKKKKQVSKEVTFIAKFKDGRKLMATTDLATFKVLKGASL